MDAVNHANAIPCDGCTICCTSEQVILREEAGDVLDTFDHEWVETPLYPGRKMPALKRNPATGHCIYLVDHGVRDPRARAGHLPALPLRAHLQGTGPHFARTARPAACHG